MTDGRQRQPQGTDHMTGEDGTVYHRSPTCKAFVAEKIDRLSRLDFLRVPPEQWTDEQRRRYLEWLPSPDELAAEMLADRRFLTRLASPI